MSSEKPAAKAVGFVYFSPEAVILFADHKKNHLHIYPPKNESGDLDFSDEKRKHFVILRSFERRFDLKKFSEKIHRLLVFGDADDLVSEGIPILDAIMEGGKIVAQGRQSVEVMLKRIEEEAVDIPLTAKEGTVRRKKKEPKKSDLTFVGQLREIKKAIGKDNEAVDFADHVGAPAVFRIMGDITQEEFKKICKSLTKKSDVSRDLARQFYRWVEGTEGEGPELGKAVDAYLYPADDDEDATEEEVAQRFSVSAEDIKFVAASYEQLVGEELEDDQD